MTDRQECIPSFPESWEDQPAFREVFLVHLPPDIGEACQHVGRFFFTSLLEAHMSEAGPPDVVRGAAADLYHVCRVLQSLVDGFDETQLLNRVAGWKDRICSIADEMRSLTESRPG